MLRKYLIILGENGKLDQRYQQELVIEVEGAAKAAKKEAFKQTTLKNPRMWSIRRLD